MALGFTNMAPHFAVHKDKYKFKYKIYTYDDQRFWRLLWILISIDYVCKII